MKNVDIHVEKIIENEFLSPSELATMLGMSLKWVEKHTQARNIPGQVKVGRLWRYSRKEIEKGLLSGGQLLIKNNG